VGAGIAVGARGVIKFSTLVFEEGGAQDASRRVSTNHPLKKNFTQGEAGMRLSAFPPAYPSYVAWKEKFLVTIIAHDQGF
jgi:hypothetical protein